MTLEISIAEQLWACLALALFGIADGVLYGLFKFIYCLLGIDIKNNSRKTALLTLFPDLLFCAISAIGFCVMDYAYYSGRVRWYLIVSFIFGFWLFGATVGKAFERVNETLSDYIRRFVKAFFALIKRLTYYILLPFIKLFDISVVKPLGIIKQKFIKHKGIRYTEKLKKSLPEIVRFDIE